MAGMTSNIDRWKKTRNTTDTTGVLSIDEITTDTTGALEIGQRASMAGKTSNIDRWTKTWKPRTRREYCLTKYLR